MLDAFDGLLEIVALVISSSLDTTVMCLFGIVAARIVSQVRVKKHGEGQSSSTPTGGARNAGEDQERNGSIGRGIDEGGNGGIGGNGERRGNGDDDDNDRREKVRDVENGRNPKLMEIDTFLAQILIDSIVTIVAFDEAQLTTTGRVIRSFSLIINLLGFICLAAVIWQERTNPGTVRYLRRTGSALALLGFILMTAINLPGYLRWIIWLTILVLLTIFMVDIS